MARTMSYESYSMRWGSLSKEIEDVANQIARARFVSVDPPTAVMRLLRKHARLQKQQAELTERYVAQKKPVV